MRSFLVIGMGRFGKNLAFKLTELKNDVMIADADEKLVTELAPNFTDAQIGDCTNEAVLKSMGIPNFDVCFVCIGENFQSSLEITSLLKELGAKYVVSKAGRDRQGKFLLRNGADEVIYPEKQMAEKTAIRFCQRNVFDYIELTPEYGIFEIPAAKTWAGRSIGELSIRTRYHINILAIKNGESMYALPGAEYVFNEDDHVIVLGAPKMVYKITSKA